MVCKTWLTIAAGCVDSGLSPWAGCGTDAATAKRTGTSMIWTILRLAGAALLVLLIEALLAIVIVPRFLYRVYYCRSEKLWVGSDCLSHGRFMWFLVY